MGTAMAEMNYMQRARLNGYRSRYTRRNSLIQDAKFERIINEDELRESAAEHRKHLEEEAKGADKILESLNDSGVELIWASQEGATNFAVVLHCHGSRSFTTNILAAFLEWSIPIKHLETRSEEGGEGGDEEGGFDVLVKCSSNKTSFLHAITKLAGNSALRGVELHLENVEAEVPWFPESIWELDKCSHTDIKYNPESDPRHPACGDKEYLLRRAAINEKISHYRYGMQIPDIEFTKEENETWKEVYTKLRSLFGTHAHSTYVRNLELFERECGYGPDEIPQLRVVGDFLKRRTGFELRPCGGLLSARDFLSSLAFRVFQATQYVRYHKAPHHSPEPDVIHEILGHAVMFADPVFAQFSQEIGLASLGASDADIEKLATVYWWIIEFGLCREDGKVKALGAGLLSAFGELEHALSGVPEYHPFDPPKTAVQSYSDDDYQPLYFVAESIEDALAKLRSFAREIKRPFFPLYDPYTKYIVRLRTSEDMTEPVQRLHSQISALHDAIRMFQLNK